MHFNSRFSIVQDCKLGCIFVYIAASLHVLGKISQKSNKILWKAVKGFCYLLIKRLIVTRLFVANCLKLLSCCLQVYAWEIADQLLIKKQSTTSCFIGAQTMRTKVSGVKEYLGRTCLQFLVPSWWNQS